jgi:hypothetical protein
MRTGGRAAAAAVALVEAPAARADWAARDSRKGRERRAPAPRRMDRRVGVEFVLVMVGRDQKNEKRKT